MLHYGKKDILPILNAILKRKARGELQDRGKETAVSGGMCYF
jgi:hypothetical protein